MIGRVIFGVFVFDKEVDECWASPGIFWVC